MTQYQVSAVVDPVSPNCIGLTGEPTGIYNGQSYWTWTNDTGTWFLFFDTVWLLGTKLGPDAINFPLWVNFGDGVVGFYNGGNYGSVGDITVAEYVPFQENIYTIQNIKSISQVIENGSVIIKCGDSGGTNLVIKSLSLNPSELTINEIQDKFDQKFKEKEYYWNGTTG